MTTNGVAPEMTKEQEAYFSSPQGTLPPIYQQHTAVMMPVTQVDKSSTTCWYVWSILATIFCCLPCGVVGLVHAMIAKHEGERGNSVSYRERMYQAKCWTSWSLGIGTAVFITVCVFVGMYMRYYWYFWY